MAQALRAGLRNGGIRRGGLRPGLGNGSLFSVAPLDLFFARTRTLDQRVTFTRASSGTYVGSDGLLKTATTNEPRFDHNPTTGASLGLLVEESRTNLYLQSENFSTTWLPTGLLAFGSGSTANAIAAPDGQITADLLVENTAAGNHMMAQNINVTTGTVYTVSAFAKAAPTTRKVQLLVSNTNFGVTPSATFDLATGTITGNNNSTAIITPFPNGWYRVTMTTIAATSTGANSASIRLVDASNANSYTGDGTSGIYLWGAQLEAGSFPTSYIPTTTATATRSADVASITGTAFSSWYRQDEGTVFVESRVQDFTVTNFSRIASLDRGDASTNFAAIVRSSALNRVEYSVYAGTGQAVGLQPAITFAGGSTLRSAFVYKTDDFIAAANETLSPADTSGTVPTAVTTLGVGMQGNGGLPYNGTIRRLTYWPQRLANSTLQAITQ